MPAITEERIAELEQKAKNHDDGAKSPIGCMALAVLELTAAIRAESDEPTPLEPPPAPPAVWSKEAPKSAGSYWFRVSETDRRGAHFVEVGEPSPGNLWAAGIGVATVPLREWPAGEWLGPIEVPS